MRPPLVLAVLIAAGCTAPSALPSPAASFAETSRTTATPITTTASLTLHWMSLSLHSEPRYRLLYEGGSETSFTQLRLIGPDGGIVAAADAVPSADEVIRMCGGGRGASTSYGALRATVILPTQALLGDVIRRPDAYRVEVLSRGSWVPVALVNECHGQE